MLELLRQLAPPALGVAAALLLDAGARRRGLDPPGFREPLRRALALAALAAVLWLTVFFPLAHLGEPAAEDYSGVPAWQLFLVHALLVAGLAAWYAAGFAGRTGAAPGGTVAEQLGLAAPAPLREIGLGVVFGVGAWFAVVASLVVVALAVAALGGEELLPKQPPAAITWIAGLPFGLRLALALSAGVVEELFFRGLVQPRAGLVFATALFALAHLSYGQPFLVAGVVLLSVAYGLLVRWRQSLWAAMTAHALFDGIQLLVVIPAVLRQFYPGAGP